MRIWRHLSAGPKCGRTSKSWKALKNHPLTNWHQNLWGWCRYVFSKGCLGTAKFGNCCLREQKAATGSLLTTAGTGRPPGRESCRPTCEDGQSLQRELGDRAPTLRSPTKTGVTCAQGTGSLQRAAGLEQACGEARGWDSRECPSPGLGEGRIEVALDDLHRF